MKRLFILFLSLLSITSTFAQSSQLYATYNDITLKLNNEQRHKLEVFNLSLIKLDIESKTKLYIEDITGNLKDSNQPLTDNIQLVEVNPSRSTEWKNYQIIFQFKNDKNKVDIDLFIKNETIDKAITLQFYKKKSPLDISITWKAPIQANRDDKTGIETMLPKYVINLEINSSEPLLEKDFRTLLNDSYQKNKVTTRKITARSIIGNNGKTIYQYDYTCEVELYEGVNKVKLEIATKEYVPEQKKSYSSVLYLNKVTE